MDITPEQCSVIIPKEEFDKLYHDGQFSKGPYKEDPTKEYGNPYIAPLWLFGELKDGRKVKAKR